MTSRTLHGVIIEWNGQHPPGSWYRWLEQMTGLSIRARNVSSPLASIAPRKVYLDQQLRDELDKGVLDFRANEFGGILQEGAIFVSSPSLARTLFFLLVKGIPTKRAGTAMRIKPSNVQYVEVVIHESMNMLPADELALNRITATLSRRGRRTAPTTFAVTCYEDMKTFKEEAHAAIRCPNCGGQHFRARPGEPVAYKDPGGDLMTAWLRTRFAHGVWEYAGEGAEPAPADINLLDKEEAAFVQQLLSAPLMDQIKGLKRADQMTVLDAVFTQRVRWLGERRLKARMDALSNFFQMGGSPVGINLTEGAPDLFDASGPLGAEFAAAKMLVYLSAQDKKDYQSEFTYAPLEEVA
jgi:hypothetical protein